MEKMEPLLQKMDGVLRILAVAATASLKQRDAIALLTRAGMKPKEIAELLGTTSNTVRVELVAIRRSARRKGK